MVEGVTISTLRPSELGAGAEVGGEVDNGAAWTGAFSTATVGGAEASGDGAAVDGGVEVTGFLAIGGNSSEPSAQSTSLIITRLLEITGAGEVGSFTADDFETTTRSSLAVDCSFRMAGFEGVVGAAGFLLSVCVAGAFIGDGFD